MGLVRCPFGLCSKRVHRIIEMQKNVGLEWTLRSSLLPCSKMGSNIPWPFLMDICLNCSLNLPNYGESQYLEVGSSHMSAPEQTNNCKVFFNSQS